MEAANKKYKSHVLVIDDDEFLLLAIKKKLELSDYKVTISSNVHDAYFKLNMTKPDLIMLDVIMPDLNGIEFMQLINSQEKNAKTPVILMSFLPRKELSKMGYDLGAAHYLDKPFDLNKLPSMIRKTKTALRT
jgi:DNA-binding response OmpR family regulator